MNTKEEFVSLRQRIAKAPQTQRIMPNTRRRLFAVLGEAGLKELTGDNGTDRARLWQLITGRNVNSTNDLLDMEAKVFADWLTNPNTGQPRHEAVAAVRSLLTGAAGEGQAEMDLAEAIGNDLHNLEREGENMEQQERAEVMELLGAVHVEARTIAYTSFILKGVQINFTMREGATAEMVKDLVREMGQVSQWLKELGADPVLSRDALANGNGRTMPAPQAPQQVEGNGDGTESFKVETIIAQVSPNGNRYYAIRGGRCKQHGVTAWPEVAEPQLEQLTEFNPADLQVGVPWDVTGYNITATGEVPAGKNYPKRVIAFQ